MKKYLRTIESRLTLPAEVRRRVMEDLHSTIEERREAGQSDQQIMEELGKPQKVAQELNRQMQEYAQKKSPWYYVCLFAAVISFLAMLVDLFADTIVSKILTDANNSLGIIGGADGPTAIFVTTATGFDWEFVILAAVFIISIVFALRLRKGRK